MIIIELLDTIKSIFAKWLKEWHEIEYQVNTEKEFDTSQYIKNKKT